MRASTENSKSAKQASKDCESSGEVRAPVVTLDSTLVGYVVIGKMMAQIAHELNQPIQAMINYATACRAAADEGAGGADLSRMLDRLVIAAERVVEIVTRVRQFTRSGDLQASTVIVEDVIDEAIEAVEYHADSCGVVIDVELCKPTLAIEADRIQMLLVLVNLLRNGIESVAQMPEDQESRRRGRVTARVTMLEDGWVDICINDQGGGLDEQVFARLFEPIVSTKSTGTGIGLAYARCVMESHNGKIFAEPPSSDGAAFHVQLPARVVS